MERVLRYLLFMTPGIAIGVLLWLALLGFRRRRMRGRCLADSGLRELAMALFWMFSGGMAVITLSPEPGWLFAGLVYGDWYPYFDLGGLSHRVNLIPFAQLDSLFNIIGNVVMFLPFGFFAGLLWRGFTWRRALALGLGITVSIECWQILTGRYFDIDDIILNTLGVLGGYLIWALLGWTAPGFAEAFHLCGSEETK